MSVRWLPVMLVLAAATPGSAQQECEGDPTTLNLRRCAQARLAAAERELASVLAEHLDQLEAPRDALLLESQRVWERHRAAHCEFVASRFEGGSLQPALLTDCFARVTRGRVDELRESLEDEPAEEAATDAKPLATQASVGPTASLPGLAHFVAVDASVVALTRVTVVDGTGAPARWDRTVILRGDRIETEGPSATTAIPAGARVLELAGHTLIPGLVQLHEHTYFGGVRRVTQMRTSGPLLYLGYGVTTALTAGSMLPNDELAMKRAVDAGELPGPRFHIAGPYLNGSAGVANSRGINTPEAVRRHVAAWADSGATWFKFLGRVSREVLGAAIDEAHARGLRVTGHLCSVTFTEAAALGIDALQHGFITNSDYVPGKQPDVCPPENMRIQADIDVASDAVQSSIRAIASSSAAVVSTLGVYETFVPGRARLDPRGLAYLHPATRAEVEANHANLEASGLIVPPGLLRKMMDWEIAFVRAGGLLGAGSDPWGTGCLPGLGNLRNYELLFEAGFVTEEAIRIMTLNGAKILGEDARLGSIEAGKVADLVVIRGDPISTPVAIYEVVTVFKDGVGYDAAKLRESAKGRVGSGS